MAPCAVVPDRNSTEFGPGGYLPPRAAKRARKIVLRQQMGLHWPIAAGVAGALILLVIIPLVWSSQGPPGAPYVPAGPLSAIDASTDGVVDVQGRQVLILRGGGVLQAFVAVPPDARYCPQSRRIESPTGDVWTAQGRLIAGQGASLDQARALAHDGTLYVDVSDPTPGLPPLLGDQQSACH
ncbi:hypothetical protein BH24ACT15_BH24ACT15_34230 [soil metagenome]